MGMPGPGGLVRKQTEAVSAQFDQKKGEVMAQIDAQVNAQLAEVGKREKAQNGALDKEIDRLVKIKEQMGPDDPHIGEVNKRIAQLKEQKRMLKAQTKLAIASIKANAARQKENMKSNLERQKAAAIRQAVDAVLAQFSQMMMQRQKEETVNRDELKSGNRG